MRGIVVDYRAGWSANLNTPSIARVLIEAALAAGWAPRSERRPFVIEDGFAFFRVLSKSIGAPLAGYSRDC
jgi:hypothetical protein